MAVLLTVLALVAVALAGGFERAGTAAKSVGRQAAAVVVPDSAPAEGAVLGASDAALPALRDDGTETPAFDQYGTLITICHNPGSDQDTLRVPSVEPHLAHGDYVGPCW